MGAGAVNCGFGLTGEYYMIGGEDGDGEVLYIVVHSDAFYEAWRNSIKLAYRYLPAKSDDVEEDSNGRIRFYVSSIFPIHCWKAPLSPALMLSFPFYGLYQDPNAS